MEVIADIVTSLFDALGQPFVKEGSTVDNGHLVLWIAFWIIVVGILALDLLVFNRRAHKPSLRESLAWSGLCIAVAFFFFLGIYYVLGAKPAIAYLTAYLVEESLSVDNLFVFLLIFRFFQVADAHQHRVLFWGVIGAIVMRFMMIFGGIALVHQFHWVLYIFGGFLVYMGVKLAFSKDAAPKDPTLNPAVRLVKKLLPVTRTFHGEHFFVRENGRLKATPMLLVLVTVEFSDLVFAIDSIPAVFGISQDLFIILTSNVFAILGLRALYFVLVGLVDRFYYLQVALSFILSFIGIKMLIAPWFAINDMVSLGIVMGTLVLAAVASVIRSKKAG